MLEAWVRRLAVAATIGMFIVLIMGSTVTNTGSEDGCGRSWPLCHGKFLPTYTVKTAIELSHRAVTGVESFLIFGTALGALWFRRKQRGVVWLTAAMVGTLFLQAGMGAAAVMWPQSAVILATHFGISLLCLASVFLLTRLLLEPFDQAADPSTVSAKPITYPRWVMATTWATLGWVIFVSYVGAYMRHSGNDLACPDWPNCNSKAIPSYSFPVAVALGHRVFAAIAIVLVFALATAAYRRRFEDPEMYRATGAAAVFIVLQAGIGGAVVISRLHLWATLAHSGMMALLFVAIADVCRLSLRGRQQPETAPQTRPFSPALKPSV